MEIAIMIMHILNLSSLVASIIDLHDYESEILIALQMNFVIENDGKLSPFINLDA